MQLRKPAGIFGAVIGLGPTFLNWAKRILDADGFIHLPHDIQELLLSASEVPHWASYLLLIMGISCVAFLIYDTFFKRAVLTVVPIPQPTESVKKISILLGSGDPFVTTEPAGVNRRQFVRVKIKNNTDKEITNGRLGIASLDPPNAGASDFEIKSDITIGAGSECFVDIACYDMGTAQANPGQRIQLIVPRVGAFFAEAYEYANLPLHQHTFDLIFSRFSEVYDRIFCTLYLTNDRFLCLEPKLAPRPRTTMAQEVPDTSLFRISTGESGRYFSTQSRGFYSTERTLYLKVENVSPSTAVTDISVIVSSIEPQSDYEGPWTTEAGFSLPAGGHRYIPLANYGEASDALGYGSSVYDRSDSFFEVLTNDSYRPTAGKERPQIISVRATGLGSAPCDYRCRVWVEQPSGRLRIEDA